MRYPKYGGHLSKADKLELARGGVEDRDRVTANLVGAAFLHTSSRALDPQLQKRHR